MTSKELTALKQARDETWANVIALLKEYDKVYWAHIQAKRAYDRALSRYNDQIRLEEARRKDDVLLAEVSTIPTNGLNTQ